MIHLNNIVIVGVGGTGISAIAGMLLDLGYTNIVGIDARENDITRDLRARGVQIIIGHGQYEVQEDDFVIYVDVPSIIDGPELTRSRALQASETKHYHMAMSYNQFVAELSKHMRTMCITGTNGKSSTTALAITAGLAGSTRIGLGIVGARLPAHDHRNYVIGDKAHNDMRTIITHIIQGTMPDPRIWKKWILILEACEYKEHFLMYDSSVTVTTNLTHDHHDYYPTSESYDAAFCAMWKKTTDSIIIPIGDQGLVNMTQKIEKNIIMSNTRKGTFDHVVGDFRGYNAGMIIDAWHAIDNDFQIKDAEKSLCLFKGLGRRMEYVGMYHNSRIYSDYGHHPDALKQLIPSMRSLYPDHRLTILFEPHQGQRLLSLWDEFVNALAAADHVIIYTPYTAREDRSVLNIIAQKTIGQEILDADQLGHAFATQVGGQYINQIDQLGNTGDDVILVLSAGLLDSVVRDLIQG